MHLKLYLQSQEYYQNFATTTNNSSQGWYLPSVPWHGEDDSQDYAVRSSVSCAGSYMYHHGQLLPALSQLSQPLCSDIPLTHYANQYALRSSFKIKIPFLAQAKSLSFPFSFRLDPYLHSFLWFPVLYSHQYLNPSTTMCISSLFS